ncbi:hypothetical protein [Klebsiella aerogenes]|uniref:hypothetical protein n=1 Tax=Klebsiella aerogenes TaxID=548 RepID=UPI00049FC1DD|nr:hypothetical protein [Klebsiella aerogenes]EMF0790001.1 hypothetical protein [Klebsiella aerogenes]KDF14251.1 hypothetical protein AF47_04722 [Klebsiella aerogenes MGH 61]RSW42385.1 hypothetical protein EGH44_25345 [Klebsiella aerogenes]HEJ0336708.1 hypothetical protein [Klebsiella aerogenes]
MLIVTDNYFFGAAFNHKNSSAIIQPEELIKQYKNKQLCISNDTTIIVCIKSHTLLLEVIKMLLKFRIKNLFIYIKSINENSLKLDVSSVFIISGKLRPQKFIEIINQAQQKKYNLPIVKLEKITPRDWGVLLFLFRGLDRKIISTLFHISEKAISLRVNLVCSKLKIPHGNRAQKIHTLEVFFTIYLSRNNERKKDQDSTSNMACALHI